MKKVFSLILIIIVLVGNLTLIGAGALSSTGEYRVTPDASPSSQFTTTGMQDMWYKFDLGMFFGTPGSGPYSYALYFNAGGTVTFQNSVTVLATDAFTYAQTPTTYTTGQTISVSSINEQSVSLPDGNSIVFVDWERAINYAMLIPDQPLSAFPGTIEPIGGDAVEAPAASVPPAAAPSGDGSTFTVKANGVHMTATGLTDKYYDFDLSAFGTPGHSFALYFEAGGTVSFDTAVSVVGFDANFNMSTKDFPAGTEISVKTINEQSYTIDAVNNNSLTFVSIPDAVNYKALIPDRPISEILDGEGGSTYTPPAPGTPANPAAPVSPTTPGIADIRIIIAGLQDKWLKFDLATVFGGYGGFGGSSAPGSMGYTFALYIDHGGSVSFPAETELTYFDVSYNQSSKKLKSDETVSISSINGYSLAIPGTSDSIAFVDASAPGNYAMYSPDQPRSALPSYIKITDAKMPFRIPAGAWITLVVVIFLVVVIIINVKASEIKRRLAAEAKSDE